MATTIHRFTFGVAAIVATLTSAAMVSPAASRAAECGPGTVYDAGSNTCVVAEAPPPALPPPPPPPPPYTGPVPWVGVSICAPIPFVSICAGI
jgi:hypothetical protein